MDEAVARDYAQDYLALLRHRFEHSRSHLERVWLRQHIEDTTHFLNSIELDNN